MTNSKFVIVKHDAKKARLHYDLRFIMPNSKLWASFAVRKGVPEKPGIKVLAVRTHDHTEKEALFFGTIEQGYGAGKLTKWDDGQCIIHKFSPGHIAIEFKGRKIKGLYHMISTGVMNRKEFKKKSYMLFKSKNASLQKINEKEWDEPDSYSTYLKRDRFIMQNRKLDYSDEYNDETHSQQPTYFGLHSKIGGDYLGRDTMANMFRDVHGAVKRMGLQDREHEFRHSFLKPGQTTILKPGESYEHATRKLDRQEKEFPKKSQFPKLTEGEIRKLINDWFGMISHIPSIFADDVEEGPSYWEGPKLPWSKDLIYVKNGKQNKK